MGPPTLAYTPDQNPVALIGCVPTTRDVRRPWRSHDAGSCSLLWRVPPETAPDPQCARGDSSRVPSRTTPWHASAYAATEMGWRTLARPWRAQRPAPDRGPDEGAVPPSPRAAPKEWW